MYKYFKYIGAIIGFFIGGTIGAILGFLLGLFIGYIEGVEAGAYKNPYEKEEESHTQKNTVDSSINNQQKSPREIFLDSFLLLSTHIIMADGRAMHSELETVRKFLYSSFDTTTSAQCEKTLIGFIKYNKSHTSADWNTRINNACSTLVYSLGIEERTQLLLYLCEIAKADNKLDPKEISCLKNIAVAFQLNAEIIDQMLSLGNGGLEEAYKTLGVSPEASDDEIKSAYRKMALLYHPDRVANLGPDIQEKAKVRFQQINAAKTTIYKARGIK